MRFNLRRLMAMAFFGMASLLFPEAPARAGLTLLLSSGSYSEQVSEATPSGSVTAWSGSVTTSPGSVSYGNSSLFGLFSIQMISAESNSLANGPGVISEMNIDSLKISNLSSAAQTLTISMSDTGFQPDNATRPLMVYNTASATFRGLSNGTLTYQTFAFDGTALFQTGAGAVSTDPVVLTPNSTGSTTLGYFTPQNDEFSMTSVMTIQLAGGAIVTFDGDSLVHAPEPGTAALAFTGTLPLAIGLWYRRRRVAA
jgi:hypothetical protein